MLCLKKCNKYWFCYQVYILIGLHIIEIKITILFIYRMTDFNDIQIKLYGIIAIIYTGIPVIL